MLDIIKIRSLPTRTLGLNISTFLRFVTCLDLFKQVVTDFFKWSVPFYWAALGTLGKSFNVARCDGEVTVGDCRGSSSLEILS